MWRDRSLFDFHKYWERDKDTDAAFSEVLGDKGRLLMTHQVRKTDHGMDGLWYSCRRQPSQLALQRLII